MSTSYNNCMYTTVPDEDIPVMFDFSEQELLNDPYEWDEEFFRKLSEEEEREEEAFQVILMNEEEMLSFGNALEEYCESKQGDGAL